MSILIQADLRGTISIPKDKSPETLVNEAYKAFEKANIPLPPIDEGFIQLVSQDLPLVSGQTLNVHVYDFRNRWTIQDGRNAQAPQADGNAAAQLIWVTETLPIELFVSIPNVDTRLFHSSLGKLYAPCFYRNGRYCEFGLNEVGLGWHGDGSLVAFSLMRGS